MSKTYIGVDIGAKGGICAIRDGEIILAIAFPKESDRPSIRGFVNVLLTFDLENLHVCIEDLHSIFGTSASSNFSFGWINGAIESALITLNIPYSKILPKTWQKEMWQGIRPVEIDTKKKKKDGTPKYKIDTKATSLLSCKRLFPKETFLATERSKVPHDGIIDSVLLCEYARRKQL